MSRARRRRPKRRARADRPPAEPRLDLHLHTTASDGRYPALEVLGLCAKRGLHTVALTDHDVPPELAAGPHTVDGRTIRLVHAAEVSAVHEGMELHFLVYFSGPMPQRFIDFLTHRAQRRAERYDLAAAALGLPPADDDARAGRRALTRHHLARALVTHKLVGTVQGAFHGPLARSRGVVPPITLPVADALEEMAACGGVSVWAHPRLHHARDFLDTFTELGLQGVEAYRPSASLTQRAELARMALARGLVVTGGSDWHGWGGRLGSFRVRATEIAPFLERLDPSPGVRQDSGTREVDPPGPEAVDVF